MKNNNAITNHDYKLPTGFTKIEEIVKQVNGPTTALSELANRLDGIQKKFNYPETLNVLATEMSRYNFSNGMLNNIEKTLESVAKTTKSYDSIIKSLECYEKIESPFYKLNTYLENINNRINNVQNQMKSMPNIEKLNSIIDSSRVMTSSIQRLSESVNKLNTLSDRKYEWYLEIYKTLSISAIDNIVEEENDNLYKNIAKETSYKLRNNECEDIDISDSISNQIIQKGVSCCSLLSEITNEDETLLKFTPNHYKYTSYISSTIADDEEKFSIIVGACYKLIYEGFGKDKLRTEKYVLFDELPFMITVKHLRLGYAHDIYHGSEKDIKEKKQNIKIAFERLIDKGIAVTSMDYKKAQLKLYELMEEWLLLLLSRIIEKQSKELIGV